MTKKEGTIPFHETVVRKFIHLGKLRNVRITLRAAFNDFLLMLFPSLFDVPESLYEKIRPERGVRYIRDYIYRSGNWVRREAFFWERVFLNALRLVDKSGLLNDVRDARGRSGIEILTAQETWGYGSRYEDVLKIGAKGPGRPKRPSELVQEAIQLVYDVARELVETGAKGIEEAEDAAGDISLEDEEEPELDRTALMVHVGIDPAIFGIRVRGVSAYYPHYILHKFNHIFPIGWYYHRVSSFLAFAPLARLYIDGKDLWERPSWPLVERLLRLHVIPAAFPKTALANYISSRKVKDLPNDMGGKIRFVEELVSNGMYGLIRGIGAHTGHIPVFVHFETYISLVWLWVLMSGALSVIGDVESTPSPNLINKLYNIFVDSVKAYALSRPPKEAGGFVFPPVDTKLRDELVGVFTTAMTKVDDERFYEFIVRRDDGLAVERWPEWRAVVETALAIVTSFRQDLILRLFKEFVGDWSREAMEDPTEDVAIRNYAAWYALAYRGATRGQTIQKFRQGLGTPGMLMDSEELRRSFRIFYRGEDSWLAMGRGPFWVVRDRVESAMDADPRLRERFNRYAREFTRIVHELIIPGWKPIKPAD